MNDSAPWTAECIRALKGCEKIVALTAAEYGMAKRLDEAGIQLILVGDSLGMTVLGYENTLPVTLDEMLHHTAAVARGTRRALVMADMPFLSYQVSVEQAIANAGRFLKEARAGAVKIEGGAFRAPTVAALVSNGIPVLGHIGLTPQSLQVLGGYKVQGRKLDEAARLRADALALQEAGVFALVLECLPVELAREITASIRVPTIGIGAGPHCDGQVLVVHDLLGLTGDRHPKFVKQYAQLGEDMKAAFENFRRDVQEGRFPGEEHCYT